MSGVSNGGTDRSQAGYQFLYREVSAERDALKRELNGIKATHIYRWIEKCQIAREALAEIRDLDPSLTPDGFGRDELSSYDAEVAELCEAALRDTE